MVVTFLFLTCTKATTICDVPNFQDTWWQVYFSDVPYGDCYAFLTGGQIIVTDGEETWPKGRWAAESHECYSTIITDDGLVDAYQDGDCLLIVLDDKEYKACACSYDT